MKQAKSSAHCNCLLAGMVLLGTVQAYTAVVPLSGAGKLLLELLVVMAALACGVLTRVTSAEHSAAGVLAAAAICCVIRADALLRGACGSLNFWIAWWNIKYEDGKRLFPAEGMTEGELFFCALTVMLLMAAVVWESLRRQSRLQLGILLTAILFPGCAVGRFSPPAAAWLLTAWMGIWFLQCRGKQKALCAVWMAAIGGTLLTTAAVTGGRSAQCVTQLREQAWELVQELRFGKDNLPEGDLRQSGSMNRGAEPVLAVTCGQASDLYLRGFIGADYRDGVWSPVTRAAFGAERTGMLSWLAGQGFYPASQYAYYERLGGEAPEQRQEIRIENLGADRKYLYLPYSAEKPAGRAVYQNLDAGYGVHSLFGGREYTVSACVQPLPGELLQQAEWLVEPDAPEELRYVQEESIYRDFVYEQYLGTDETLRPCLERLFEETEKPDSVYEAAVSIRSVLEEQTVYAGTAKPEADGADPLIAFLTEKRPGSEALYASAAVQAFRMYGIPARYAEGYLVQKQRAAEAPEGRVVLCGADGHAWCEVYLDGVGWVPVDVTPGYYYDAYALIGFVKQPFMVQRTTARQEEAIQSSQVLEPEKTEPEPERPQQEDADKRMLTAGILTALAFAAALALTCLEISHGIRELRWKKRLSLVDNRRRCEILCGNILSVMAAVGIQAQPGWQTDRTEECLCRSLPCFAAGEYSRVSGLMERCVYGGLEPEAWELRTLEAFLEKLYSAGSRLDWKTRLRLRYLPVRFKIGCE